MRLTFNNSSENTLPNIRRQTTPIMAPSLMTRIVTDTRDIIKYIGISWILSSLSSWVSNVVITLNTLVAKRKLITRAMLELYAKKGLKQTLLVNVVYTPILTSSVLTKMLIIAFAIVCSLDDMSLLVSICSPNTALALYLL